MARPSVCTVIGPYCVAGHKRNAKNTSWIATSYGGRRYLQARCLVCTSEYNQRRPKKIAPEQPGYKIKIKHGERPVGIKKVTVSFDVPITAFLGLIASGHSEMKISVFGDDPKPKKPKLLDAPRKMLALPAPKTKHMQATILATLAQAANKTDNTAQLRAALVAGGFSPNSLPGQLYMLKRDKLIALRGRGVYALTAAGQKKAVAHG